MKFSIKTLLSGSIILGLSSLISRLLWVYRDHLLASKFWASVELDAYFSAFRIPDLIYSLFIFATISVAFLPLYIKKEKKLGLEWANIFTSKVLNLVIIFTWVFAFLIAIFAPYFIWFYTSWFDPEAQKLTLDLMRIMLLSPIFFAISSVLIAVHNASHNFITQWLAPIFYNLWIVWSIFFSDEFWIKALAYWVVIWAFFHCIIQFPFLFKKWFRWKFNLSFDKEILWMLKTAFPRMMSVSIYQVSLTTDILIAWSLAVWSVTILNLSANIASLPLWMIVTSIAITAFTYLSKKTEDLDDFKEILKKNINKTAFWTFPALFWLYAVSEPLIKFLFLSWEFTIKDVFLTKEVLLFLLISIWFQSFIPILNRAYFAFWETKKPFYISLVSMIFNIFASFYFSKIFWIIWIAIWSIIWMFIYSALLIFFTKKDFWKIIPYKNIFYSISSWALMFIWIYFLSKIIENYHNLLQLIILIPFWGLIYLWLNFSQLKNWK